MKNSLQPLALAVTLLAAGCAVGEEYEAPQLPPPPPPPPAPTVESAPSPEPYPQASSSAKATAPAPAPAPRASALPAPPSPPASPPPAQEPQLVYTYPGGQWVYLAGQGWVWIPSGAAAQDFEGVPYVYLYTPAYGWTWYVSPWGVGPYVYGAWVHHPWHPAGLHGYWVARPGVVRRFARHR